MSQRVHPWTRWRPAVGLVSSQSGSGAVQLILDLPPVISSLPAPVFTAGIPASYDMKQHVTDDGYSTVSYLLSGTLPVGITFNPTTGILSYDGAGSLVSMSDANVIYNEISAACFAGVRLGSSGTEYENPSGASQLISTPRGTWLEFGVATGVWVEYTIGGLSSWFDLNWYDPGPGRISCSTNPAYGISIVAPGTRLTQVQFDFYDQAVGGVLLQSNTLTLGVTNE